MRFRLSSKLDNGHKLAQSFITVKKFAMCDKNEILKQNTHIEEKNQR